MVTLCDKCSKAARSCPVYPRETVTCVEYAPDGNLAGVVIPDIRNKLSGMSVLLDLLDRGESIPEELVVQQRLVARIGLEYIKAVLDGLARGSGGQ